MASISSLKISPQPSLLDRLTDGPPVEAVETLYRDLSALLSATALSATRDLSAWKRVSRSVLNYGVAGFTGRMLTSADVPDIQRNLTRTIQQFEPRLDPQSVQVTVMTETPDRGSHGWRVHIVAQRRDIPTHAPVEFWAVIDAQSGQLQMSI